MIRGVQPLFRLMTFFLILMNMFSSKLSIFIWKFIISVPNTFRSSLLSYRPLAGLMHFKMVLQVQLSWSDVLGALLGLDLLVSVRSKVRPLAVLDTYTLTASDFWVLRSAVRLLTTFLATVVAQGVRIVAGEQLHAPRSRFRPELRLPMTFTVREVEWSCFMSFRKWLQNLNWVRWQPKHRLFSLVYKRKYCQSAVL